MTVMNPGPQPLEPAFFERDTLTVARDLLGHHLLRYCFKTNGWQTFTIVETEAYTADDPACHAYNRRTGRAEMLYSHPGTAYVYLIYGMYDCLNVVTEPFGRAGAVLFRALEPVFDHPAANIKPPRPDQGPAAHRTNGPGRLTRALGITRQEFNGQSLTSPTTGLYLAAGSPLPDTRIVQSTRIGITKAADYPWRFYVAESRWVSVREKLNK
jgi:DNA-3-methyladenine glycosylase